MEAPRTLHRPGRPVLPSCRSARSQLAASGPAGDQDLYVVTLSGEADNSAAGGFSTLQAQASINGGAFVNMNPSGPNTFLQSTVAETNTMTWCRRIAAANSVVIRVIWQHFGAGVSILDDYTVLVHRSN